MILSPQGVFRPRIGLPGAVHLEDCYRRNLAVTDCELFRILKLDLKSEAGTYVGEFLTNLEMPSRIDPDLHEW